MNTDNKPGQDETVTRLVSIPDGVKPIIQRNPSPTITKDRLVIVEQVYHQRVGQNPTMVSNRFSKELDTQEQPWSRIAKVDEEWSPINKGTWIDQVGMIVLKNEAVIEPITLEWGIFVGTHVVPIGKIPSSTSIRLYVGDVSLLRIRSNGKTMYTVTLFPA